MEFGDIIYLIIFLVISLLSSLSNKKEKNKKNKPKPNMGNQTQRKPAAKKDKSPLELLEEMFNDSKEPEPVYVPPKVERQEPIRRETIRREPAKRTESVSRPKPEVIDLPKKKKYIRSNKYSTNAKSLRSKLKNPDTIRDLIVTSEILGKPKAFQD